MHPSLRKVRRDNVEYFTIQYIILTPSLPLPERYNVSVLEGVVAGSQFATIVANDDDSEEFGQVTYSILASSDVRWFF